MARGTRSFRTKMLLLFMTSIAISGAITYLIYRILQSYYRKYVFAEDFMATLRRGMLKIGDVNTFLVIFIPLAIIIFYLLSKPYVKYFKMISTGIHHLANGDFQSRVMISSKDEFQLIAEDINRAAFKLQEAVVKGEFAESSKDQLVLNLAHDLRTPLTSVIGYLEYIMHHKELPQEVAVHYMNIAYSKSKRLEMLIEQLFEITRMNYGHLTLKKKDIDLTELMSQLVDEMYPIFESHQIETRTNFPDQTPIHADGELLARVFENLLTNATRYGSDGKYIDIDIQSNEQYVTILISNYGSDIPLEEQPYIFDMFYSGDRARTHPEGSTGLGLYIAKNIVQQHGGQISVQSDVTKTTFQIFIPKRSET